MTSDEVKPFGEHIQEIRRRLIYCVGVLLAGCTLGYILRDSLFRIINEPLGQQLYYTSPVGGFNAVIKLSVLFGLVIAVPVIVYQVCQFVAPAFKNMFAKKPLGILVMSLLLAGIGVLFGYYVSLPSALNFLTNVQSQNLEPLIVANDYLNFVFAYLLGFAILFQIPLIMLFINRAKPLKAGQLMRMQRWVILSSFVVAAILTPTPDPLNQVMMAVPVIILYELSVVLVLTKNRHTRRKNERLA